MNLTRWKSPTNDHKEILDFRYGILKSPKTSIRLVQILPGSGNKGLSINLVDSFVSGPSKIPYDALSYTWGDGARTKFVSCSGRRLGVTQTLLEALLRFRDPDRIVTLWADQICICQERVKERNQQVSMMGDIFRSARKVIVWLGEDYEDSRAGMQLAYQLCHIAQRSGVTTLEPTDIDSYGLPQRGHRKWKALASILRRPWFWRTWIVQEVVLNPNVELVLGGNTLSWDDLEKIVVLLEGPAPKIWHLGQAISASELPFSRINRIRQRHRRRHDLTIPAELPRDEMEIDGSIGNLTAEPEDIYPASPVADDPELLDLLLMSRGLGATDPRDKIYALLGLGKHDIVPDYDTSAEDVFIEFAQHQIGAVTSLFAKREGEDAELDVTEREIRRAMVMLSCAGRANQYRKLPSWVPDWTITLAARPLIFGLGERYRAGGSKLGVFDYDFDKGLQLSGVLLDTVRVTGSVWLDTNSDSNPHTLVEEWWKEAQEIAMRRIARSPGSTGYTDAFEAMRRRLQLCRHGYYIGTEGAPSKRRQSFLDETDIAITSGSPHHSASQTLTVGSTRGRVMFASSTGYLGLVPHGTKKDDLIFIVRGADVPYVLRPNDDAYQLVGEAYVQGVMEGEALEMGNVLVQDIVLR
jgi:hypothetical protein